MFMPNNSIRSCFQNDLKPKTWPTVPTSDLPKFPSSVLLFIQLTSSSIDVFLSFKQLSNNNCQADQLAQHIAKQISTYKYASEASKFELYMIVFVVVTILLLFPFQIPVKNLQLCRYIIQLLLVPYIPRYYSSGNYATKWAHKADLMYICMVSSFMKHLKLPQNIVCLFVKFIPIAHNKSSSFEFLFLTDPMQLISFTLA